LSEDRRSRPFSEVQKEERVQR